MNIGERIGDYEIVGILGAGGMGQVYKVRNVLSDRIEAMKVLLPNLEGDQDLADRFLREIKVQAAMDHPNIAKLHTAMRAGNQLVMVMEFIDGTSIAKLLERGPLPASVVVAYTGQVLDALAYAHSRGVIHRDIKPANIMLATSPQGQGGTIKLMDFGIARMKADQRLTQTGSTVGSLYYMSPEQIRGNDPDPRSDLYSLGITTYEMVTGQRPFAGDSDYQIMSAHLQQVPAPPIEIVPGVPSALSDLILMSIEKDPAARFQTAEAFRAALGNVLPANAGRTQTIVAARPAMPQAAPASPTVAQPSPNVAQRSPQQAPPPLPSAAPSPVAGQPASSRRGLYMALGSVATLVVLIGAVIEGPKLMHGGASAQSVPTPVATPAAQNPSPQAPTPAPSSAAPAQAPAAVVPAPAAAPAATQPTRPAQAVPAQVSAPVAAPVPVAAPTQAAQPGAAPPAATRTPSPELNQLREQFNEISIRASTAKEGLASIEQQMARQGLGLRGDMRETRTRLDYQLQEAMASIQRGDVDGARQNLQYAQRAVETIEKFLGR
jgi:serine/threonine protein kinase